MTFTDIGVGDRKVDRAVDQILAPQPRAIDEIDIRSLNPSPDNPAGRLDDDVDDLADSIRSIGILEPLIVASARAWQAADDRMPFLTEGEYVVLAGHRRLGAARKVAGGGEDVNPYLVPCIVRDDLVGADADVAMAVENSQRKDLSAIEEARIYQRLQDQHHKSQRDIAELVGRNQSHISKRLALLKLPEDLQAKVGGDMPVEDAIAIAKHADDPQLVKAIAERPDWRSIDDVVETHRRDLDRAAAVTKAKKRLEAQGVQNIITLRQHDYLTGYGTPRPLSYLAEDGVDVDDHEHFACHAVVIDPAMGEIRTVPACTNPKVHPESRDNRQAASETKRKAHDEREQKAKQKRLASRVTAVKSAVAKIDADTEQVVGLVHLQYTLDGSFDREDYEQLVDCLGKNTVTLPVADDENAGRLRTHDAELDAVLVYAKTSATALRRTLAAATLLSEARAAEFGWQTDAGKAAFLEWLPTRGHKLTGPERDALKRAKGDA